MTQSLPDILATYRDSADSVRLQLHIPAGLMHFAGHFPCLPLLPGVIQIDWAIHLGREHLPLVGEFIALENIKFQGIVLPDAEAELLLSWQAASRKLNFAYSSRGEPARNYSSGRIAFTEAA